ncbi:MAG: DNA polymerase III subunit gamma/tau [Bacteroidales bacterium]|nr:DNA polymerase III subunit gamma/tau [Bacteroidales bacterium]
MGQFIVSARKYRPATFDRLIGQENIARTLKNSILSGQLAHAYLFCGPRGVGKTSCARIFAKTINCSNPGPDMEPCGECESCRSFAEGRSYCIHELDAASNNSVEDIRTLTDQVRIPPQIGRYSVYIIDEVHMLSQAAFNAFLKTLEEPPEYAIFILATTEKHKILPTILSRCQTYDFNRIRVEDIVRNLKDIAASENVTISDDALHIIAQKADGAMRDALTLFDQTVAFCGGEITYEQVIGILNVLDYEYYFRLTDMFLAGDFASALVLFDEILSKGFNALHFISGLSSHLRDLIVCKTATSRGLLEMAPTIAAKYDQYSARCQMGFLYQALDVTTSCEAQYKASGNPRLLIEFALIKIARLVSEVATAPQPAAVQGAVKLSARPAAVPRPEPVSANKPAPEPQPAAPQPDPQPAPEPAPKPAPAATKTPGVSIKNLMSQASAAPVAKRSDAQEESATAGRQPSDITEEVLKEAWDEFLTQIEKPNLRAALAVNKPQYSAENNAVTQFVASELQKNWIIEKQLLPLQAKLQKALGIAGVRLQIEVLPQSELPKDGEPYMPTEMAKAMMKESSQMENFSREFELEVS